MSECIGINHYCFLCGIFVAQKLHIAGKKNVKNYMTTEFKFLYKRYYFPNEPDMFGADFTPNNVCSTCYANLGKWQRGEKKHLPYMTPVQWAPHLNGHDANDCYACINYTIGRITAKTKVYRRARTGTLPVPHNPNLDPPEPPSAEEMSAATTSDVPDLSEAFDPTYEPESPASKSTSSNAAIFDQKDMDYMVAKANMSQRMAEWITSFMKKKNATSKHVNGTAYRRRQKKFLQFFSTNGSKTTAYCKDIKGLFAFMNMEYNIKDWRLFIDGSTSSLKAVLLHNTNKMPSIPLFYSTDHKEDYDSLE